MPSQTRRTDPTPGTGPAIPTPTALTPEDALEAELRAEAEADAAANPDSAWEWDHLSEEERVRACRDSAAWRAGVRASAHRAGFASIAEYLDVVDPLPEGRAPIRVTTERATFPEPEDRGTATLSELGEVEYIDDFIRPGRIVVVAAEEGAGKSYAIGGELAIRVAVAGGSFAGTWPVLRTGPVLYMSEMHTDDDYGRETTVLSSLGLERPALAGRYYRLPLMTAAGGRPALAVPEWRAWVTGWLRDHEALLLIIDTATGATQVDPWGREIQAVYAALRVMLAEYPGLAIVLLIHMKKPQGRGERRISDVLGEWGRWCDVVVLMQNDGNGLTRARLTVRKRVRHERRIVVTKAGGLLTDPQDLDEAKGTKVPAAAVLAAVAADPGISFADLGVRLGVSKDTAGNYVRTLEEAGSVVTRKVGPRRTTAVYSSDVTAEPPNTTEQARFSSPSAVEATDIPTDRRTAEHLYIGSAVGSAVVTASPDAAIRCSAYHAHQSHHRFTGGAWTCDACSPANDDPGLAI